MPSDQPWPSANAGLQTMPAVDLDIWGENQRVTVDEALRICTINGAYASFEEAIKGSIKVGKLADFVVLGEDPHDVEPDAIKEIPIVRTVVGGRTMHAA